ncbi:MAG: hypothetical protein WAN20_12505 [Pseudonocardiaceae bacterium]|nr:hypothetical protein [Pseudonocardiaceae bacterium]
MGPHRRQPVCLRELAWLLTSEHRLDQPDTVPVLAREVVLRRIARLPQTTAAVSVPQSPALKVEELL